MAVTGLRRLAGRLAAPAPAPVFAAVGPGARDHVESLFLRSGVRPVSTPRHATVLLVVGGIPGRLDEPLGRVHDQLPHPRATLYWGAEAGPRGLTAAAAAPSGPGGDSAVSVPTDEDPLPALRALHTALLRGERESEPPRLPDEPPHPWRGRGDHGQGGEGMMGGVPYGRPMAMTGPDVRDGLALDRLELRVGPFLPPLPPGLVLDVVLQGDVIQEATVVALPFPQPIPMPLGRTLHEPVSRSRVDEARARLLLRRAARVLKAGGASALADRAMALSHGSRPTASESRRLRWLLRRGGTLAALPGGGPGDEAAIAGRLDGWLEEAEAALDRSRSAGGDDGGGGDIGPVQSLDDLGEPFADRAGPASERLARVVDALPGLEWGVAMLRIVAADPVPVYVPESPEEGGGP